MAWRGWRGRHMTRGFVYVPHDQPHRLLDAALGELVANPAPTPPWIVVDHDLTTTLVTSWPGRLLVVDVDQRGSMENLRPDAGYTRAISVRVIEERDPAELFGPHGAAVVGVIESAVHLTLAEAHALGSVEDPEAARAYTTAWNAWLVADDRSTSIHLGADHTGTLAIPERKRARSPIHGGFMVISSALRKRAIEVSGDAARNIDEEGESRLAEPWRSAVGPLLHAAMALGAPDLVSADDRVHLLHAWKVLTATR